MAFDKKRHLQQNIDAIRLVFNLEKEDRIASGDEKLLLKKFIGFGGLKFILNPIASTEDFHKWKAGDRPYFVLTEQLFADIRDHSANIQEYQRYVTAAKASILDAFYTPEQVTNSIAEIIKDKVGKINTMLEPSAGVGAFIDQF